MQKKFPSSELIQRTCSNFGIGLEVDIHFGVLLECQSLCILVMIIILSESFIARVNPKAIVQSPSLRRLT